jgi:uncharacterized protein YyaL (SSP411 family)
VLGLLLTDYRLNGTTESLQAVADALNAIAYGGIHDHLAGGIHRYSTEPTWSVPHFEKMLYDNAQLLGLYADLYAITRRPLARTMASDIAAYLMHRMMDRKARFTPPRTLRSMARREKAISGRAQRSQRYLVPLTLSAFSPFMS